MKHLKHMNPSMLLSLLGLFIMAGLAIFGPMLSAYDYAEVSNAQFDSPSLKHWMGTDIHGRDVLTRIFYGARISFLVGLIGAGVSMLIGVAYGLVSGYIGGKVDNVMMRIVDILYSLPRIVIVIVLIALIDEKLKNWFHSYNLPELEQSSRLILLFIALGCVEWLTMARIVRGQVLTLKSRAFIQAAQTLGQKPWRIMAHHLLPNLYGIILVYTTLTVPAVILEESFLSFLGLGVQAPRSSLGTLLAEGAIWINPVRIYWWLIIGPASCMAITLLCLNFLGDSLRDKLDTKKST